MTEARSLRGTSKWELDTPCLVLDQDVLERNIRAMQDHASAHEKKLRPHAKTHKCSRIARMQMEAGAVGICVAKVSEAEVLARNGIRGTLITSPVVSDRKIDRLMACLAMDAELMVVVDNLANALKLHEEARRRSRTLSVLVDLDPGMGRTGVAFDDAVALGREVSGLSSLRLRGLQCYAGHVQHIPSFLERTQASLVCMERAAKVARGFQAEGLNGEIFTGSGTGTHDIDWKVPAQTDLQVGSYVMMDAEYMNIGSAADPARFLGFPPALSLLTTVISTNRNEFVTVDAGLKALYHHGGTPYIVSPPNLDARDQWFGDEQGMLLISDPTRKPDLGQVVELVVSHCDPTVNLFDELYVSREGVVVDVWPIDMRGRSQ